MAKDIKGVEIFSAGSFRPGGAAKGKVVTFDEADLDELVSNFNELKPIGGFTPMLKLGHADAQKFIGQTSGAPNLGLVEKIVREGKKVLADFSNVPDAVVELIRSRRFNSVSVEIIPKLDFEGKSFKNVLVAVALLGAELPAVKGLAELSATLFTEAEVIPLEADTIVSYEWEQENMADPKMTLSQEQHEALIEAAVDKAVKAAKAEFAATEERLTAERDEARKSAKDGKAEFSAFQNKLAERDATDMVEKAIKAGKLLPKQKDAAMAFALNLKGTLKFGDEEKGMVAMFSEFLDGMPKAVDTSEKGSGSTDDGENTEYSDPGAEVDTRARKLMKADKELTYADARSEVLSEDDELKTAYTFSA